MPDKKNKVAKVGYSAFRKAERPESIEKVKTIGGEKVIAWGTDNLYPHDLVGYREDNPVHGGIIAQKITFMSSAGAEITGLGGKEEELEALLPDAVDCFETFNGFAILFKRVGDRWKPEHIDFESVRYAEEEGWFMTSDDWSARSQSEEKTNYQRIKSIKNANLLGDDADTRVLLYAKVKPKQRKHKNGKLSLCYYPVPNYSGAIIPILAGIEQDYFTFSEAVNGYKGGTLVSMNNGQPATDEQADEIADKIKAESTDRDTQGGVTVVFADGADNAATVMSLNGNDLDKRYLESNKEIRNKILIGHAAGSPTLFAVNSESTFGSKEEMEVSYILLTNNYINKRQKFISESLEWAFERLGMKDVIIKFRKYQLDLGSDGGATTEQMSAKADPILVALKRTGVEREGADILRSETFDFETSDADCLAKLNKFSTLTETQQLIVKLIKDGKTFSEVSLAVGKGALWLSLELIKLNSLGVLKGWKISDSVEVDLEVRYSYEVKAGLGPDIIAGSRSFCRGLISLDKLYTRSEIETLSNEMATDVWRYRGGWYTNPSSGKTTPSCRHEWKQNVVRR